MIKSSLKNGTFAEKCHFCINKQLHTEGVNFHNKTQNVMSLLKQQPGERILGSGRRVAWAALIIVIFVATTYLYLFKTNVPSDLKLASVKIPTNSSFDDLVNQLLTEGVIMDESDFRRWADWSAYNTVRPGRFRIEAGWSSYELIKHIHKGEQSPVKVVLNNERTPEQVAGKVARFLERDSLTFLQTFNDRALLDSMGITRETLMCVFLPNTYEFFWNTEPRKFLERMAKEYKKFWNADRTARAAAQGLTPEQAITMASIVDGETTRKDEIPKVAGAYLNRLRQNMKLQADPTVQFALMEIEQTPSFRRLYNIDYQVAHPYNTYMHEGLPPGPICMPSAASIEAVLSPESHNYIFFVGKPDNSGYHNYAETYEQHLVNVRIYQNWLKTQNK